MRTTITRTLLLGALYAGAAIGAATDNTSAGYKPTFGGPGSVNGIVIQQSEDGYNTLPVNAEHPLPVTGTLTTTPGSGTQHVDGTGTAGTPAGGVLSVQGVASGTVLPVSAASLPLPSGASTAALQSGVQSAAGTPNATAVTVQGNASGVALPVSVSGGPTAANQTATQAPVTPATATATKADLTACQYNLSGVTFTDGQQGSIQCGASGSLYVSGAIASGATDSGNPIKVGARYNSTLPTFTNGQRGDLQIGTRGSLGVTLFGTDSASAISAGTSGDDQAFGSITALRVQAQASLFDGTNDDRQRSVVNGANSTGTGILAAGILAQLDDTSPTAITENSFGNVRMNSARALYTESGPYLLGRATADTQIKGSAGFIHTISISALTATPTAGLLTVYDSLTETGTVIYAQWVPATEAGHTITLDIPAGTGLYVGFDASLASVQATVSYR